MPIVNPRPKDRQAFATDTLKQWRTRRSSALYRDLLRLVKSLADARTIAGKILAEKHGQECRCPYCRSQSDLRDDDHVDWLLAQVSGSVWSIDQVIATLRDNV